MERKWWTLMAVSVATFMLLLDITVVNTALPSIAKDLHATFNDLQWVIDAYTLALAAVVLTAGSLADRLGRRAVFAAGLTIFSVASLAAGLAPDATFLNSFSCGRGDRRRRDVRRLARAGRTGVSGRESTRHGDGDIRRDHRDVRCSRSAGRRVITDGLGWRWVFFINVPSRDRGAGDDIHEGSRVSQPERGSNRLARAWHAQRRPVPAACSHCCEE